MIFPIFNHGYKEKHNDIQQERQKKKTRENLKELDYATCNCFKSMIYLMTYEIAYFFY